MSPVFTVKATVISMPSKVFTNKKHSFNKRDIIDIVPVDQDTDEADDIELQPYIINIESMTNSDFDETEFRDPDVIRQPQTECTSKPQKPRRRVGFSTVEIRKYPIIMGDHPDCSCGPPISIGWDYNDPIEVSLQLYEEMRPPRRHFAELVLPFRLRRELISRNCGYGDDQIKERLSEIQAIKKERQQTLAKLKYQRVEEVLELIKGSTKLIKGLRKRRPNPLKQVQQ